MLPKKKKKKLTLLPNSVSLESSKMSQLLGCLHHLLQVIRPWMIIDNILNIISNLHLNTTNSFHFPQFYSYGLKENYTIEDCNRKSESPCFNKFIFKIIYSKKKFTLRWTVKKQKKVYTIEDNNLQSESTCVTK